MDLDHRGTPLDDGGFIFRFRGIDALLGEFAELEKQEIFFSRPEMLNDPLEGLADAFWDGDDVLWENLFRHYALALIWYAGGWLLSDAEQFRDLKVFASLTPDNLPTETFRGIYREFSGRFCDEIESTQLAAHLASLGPAIRLETMGMLLRLVHSSATQHLFRVLRKHKLCDFELPRPRRFSRPAEVMGAWAKSIEEWIGDGRPTDVHPEIMARVVNRVFDQGELDALRRASGNRGEKWIAMLAGFPEMYLRALGTDLHFTPWRAACFSRRCVNASMWGTYASAHRGAALVFRTRQREGKRFFRVRGLLGGGADGDDLEVLPIAYRDRPPVLDAFLSIGSLSLQKLRLTWMSDPAGRESRRFREITGELDLWRERHRAKAIECATWKHPDWQHEDEQRLVATTPFTDDPAPTALRYEFSQLESIVFGMRTSTEDKSRIATIIEQKCLVEGRSDFRLFQAHYSPQAGQVEVAELGSFG